MKLFKHQRNFVNTTKPRCAMVWECGTGKSLAALELSYRKADIASNKIIIICPKALKEKWRRDILAVPKIAKYIEDYVIVSKEEFRRDWKDLPPSNFVIVDEAHYFFGTKSAMMRALRSYFNRHDPEYRLFLTATPYRSTPMDVYMMGKLLGYPLDYNRFKEFFFNDVRMGRNTFSKPKPADDIKEDIATLITKFGSVVRMDDCFDVPDQTFTTEPLPVTQEQQRAVDELTDLLPITRFTAEHQIMGGTWEDDMGQQQRYNSYKLERIKDLVAENDRMIIVCRYNNEIELIKEQLERDDVYVINGKVPAKERDQITQMTDTTDRYVLLVNAACSEGWEAKTCPLMVFYSYDFALKNYVQMIGRIQRVDNLKKNVYLSLYAAGTVDEAIYKTIVENKMDFHEEIYAQQIAST